MDFVTISEDLPEKTPPGSGLEGGILGGLLHPDSIENNAKKTPLVLMKRGKLRQPKGKTKGKKDQNTGPCALSYAAYKKPQGFKPN